MLLATLVAATVISQIHGAKLATFLTDLRSARSESGTYEHFIRAATKITEVAFQGVELRQATDALESQGLRRAVNWNGSENIVFDINSVPYLSNSSRTKMVLELTLYTNRRSTNSGKDIYDLSGTQIKLRAPVYNTLGRTKKAHLFPTNSLLDKLLQTKDLSEICAKFKSIDALAITYRSARWRIPISAEVDPDQFYPFEFVIDVICPTGPYFYDDKREFSFASESYLDPSTTADGMRTLVRTSPGSDFGSIEPMYSSKDLDPRGAGTLLR